MPAGLTDSTKDLEAKYNTWKNNTGPKPIPRRCGGALDLNRAPFYEPVDPGKCDSGVYWGTQNCMTGSTPWSSVYGTTAPMNGYMQLTQNGGAYSRSSTIGTCTMKSVMSETYIHLWAPSYDLNRAQGGTAATNASSPCASSQGADKAFDNLASSSNGTKWCVGFKPLPTQPVSIMYTFASSQAYAITSYSITSANDVPVRDPRDWKLQGCNGTCTVGSDSGWVSTTVGCTRRNTSMSFSTVSVDSTRG